MIERLSVATCVHVHNANLRWQLRCAGRAYVYNQCVHGSVTNLD